MGSLLFGRSIHHVVCHLKSELCIGYIDDLTVGGTLEDVQHDVALIEREAGELGLVLNHKIITIMILHPGPPSFLKCLMPLWLNHRVPHTFRFSSWECGVYFFVHL